MSNFLKEIDVFILCGGLGQRLKKISGNLPKPLINIGNYAFLDILIDYMAGFGLRRFILGTCYKAGVIKAHYNKYFKHNLEILFSEEKSPLGTGGGVKNAQKLIKSSFFFVLNGDSFCEFSPLNFLMFHKQNEAQVSMLLKRGLNNGEFGTVELNRSSRVLDFNEKYSKKKNGLINAGVYIFNKDIFKLMPRRSDFSLEFDFFPEFLLKQRMFGYKCRNHFFDIGTPERYLMTKKYLLSKRQYKKLINLK